MNRTYYAGAVLAVAMFLPAVGVFAQAAGTNFVNVTSTPNTVAVTPGQTGVNLGNYTLTATQPGSVQISSIPFTLSAAGGTASDLTDCQLVNGTSALNTSGNINNSLVAGTNNIMFDTPLTVTSGSPVTLNIRCDVSSATPSGTSFTFSAGAPILAPSLAVNLTTTPAIAPGELAAPVAVVALSGARSGSNLNITSLPISVAFGGGLSASDFANCHLQNAANLGVSMNANSNGMISSGLNSFPLDSTFMLGGGTSATMVLICDVSSASPIGGTAQFSIDPGTVTTTSASSGLQITPGVGNGTNGAAGSLSGLTTVVNANGSTTGIGTTVPPTVPGTPNTGAGGNAAMNFLILALTAVVAVGGAVYVAREVSVR